MRKFWHGYKNLIIFILSLLTMTNISYAKNLGVYGALFTIAEQDIREFIYARIKEMQQNGEMKKLKTKFSQSVKAHVLRPSPVKGLTTLEGSAKPRIFYYDPTYILAKDITDDKGRVIAKAGEIINPLNTVKLRGVLFFLNADDKRQIAWALKNVKKYEFVKYILVRGNIKEAGKLLKERIYFDQHGLLTRKLRIRHIPCIVKQVGKKLQIQEFTLEKTE